MATRIVFAAGGEKSLSIRVDEDGDSVFSSWTASGGLPFALTRVGGDLGKVWINPATVAYRHEAAVRSGEFA